ncbi:putative CheW protein [Alkaliphilus metalliredigens QYMF]|uniref:Putative CheW protein n=1 Tax=Alkaliphilus metalliredigens (strain QYMF) TaxID=293826 RepID=A6TUL1_ALKMQ|nr:chemotaxis protein CheW [Alkaliphilus metalliredigens]ABR49879.1 putative CheW protein [Alkaliphilus metalliredigens QYMF]
MSSVQFIIFELEQQQYGIEIDFVNGINKLNDLKISHIPNSPTFIEGIINLRGKIIPLYNLRKRFQFQNNTIRKNDEILIAIVNDIMIGLIVDEVVDIVRIEDTDIESTVTLFSSNITNEFISSIAKKDDQMIIILNAEKILTVKERDIITPLIEK